MSQVFINFVKQQIEIVEEESQPDVNNSAQRSRGSSSASRSRGSSQTTAGSADDELLQDLQQQEVLLDDDEPLLNFDVSGVCAALHSFYLPYQ